MNNILDQETKPKQRKPAMYWLLIGVGTWAFFTLLCYSVRNLLFEYITYWIVSLEPNSNGMTSVLEMFLALTTLGYGAVFTVVVLILTHFVKDSYNEQH